MGPGSLSGAWLVAFSLLVVWISEPATGNVFSPEPGFRVMITKKGLDYVFGPILREGLSRLSLPDIHDEKKVKIAGKVEYWLFKIMVKEANIPSTALETEENGLIIHISDMSLSMNAHWRYEQKKWPHMNDEGTVDIKAKNVYLSQRVSVRNDGSGQIVVASEGCSFDVRKISVKFHGGASWLYNLFSSYIEKKIKDLLNSQVCKMVNEAINEVGVKASLPLSVPVSDGVEVNCALIGDPVFSSSYLFTNHDGEFIWAEHPQEVPVSPPPLPHPSSVDTSDKMVYVWLTTYPLDIAAHMYRETGYMAYEVAHDQIPHFLLRTTTDFKSIIPQLYQMFPDMDVTYGIAATLSPSLLLSPGQARLVAEAEISINVLQSGQSNCALSFTVSLECSVDLVIVNRPSGQFIAGEVTSFTTEMVDHNTNIGEFNSTPFQELLDTATKFLAIPNINRILGQGQALPSHDGVTATSTVISIAEGYILVGTDISYELS